MYDDALFIVTTDNGGPTTECSTTGQSNWPLRGSKCSIWEGGTRGTGFLFWAGLPDAARGLHFGGLVHACDWLPTAVSAMALRPLGPAGLDEGLLQFSLSNLLYMENPYSYKKCQ
jgi:arylsulfatase A-like enzyme